MYYQGRTSNMTVGEYVEAQTLGDDVDVLMDEKKRLGVVAQAQRDVLTIEFGNAITTALQTTEKNDASNMLREALAMNFHKTYSVWSHDEWLNAVKQKIDIEDFRWKQRARNERWIDFATIKKIHKELKKVHGILSH